MELEDTLLLRRLARDVDTAFEDLVLAYQDRLYRFALRLTGSSAEAEDVAQDAFVRAYRWLSASPPGQDFNLRAWLYQVTLNVFRNRLRSRRPPPAPLAAASELADAAESPALVAERGETQAELAALLARLPARYREAIVLHHVEQLPFPDMAAITGRPSGTLKSDVHRGIALLRAAIAERQSTLEAVS